MNMTRCAGPLALALTLLVPGTASAQETIAAPAGFVPKVAVNCDDGTGHAGSCSFGGRQESFAVATANAPAAPVMLYGGDYILDQRCSTYGTLKVQRLGPDGATWLDTITKSASDTTTGTGVTVGSKAQVRVVVAGTAGCYATISRVP